MGYCLETHDLAPFTIIVIGILIQYYITTLIQTLKKNPKKEISTDSGKCKSRLKSMLKTALILWQITSLIFVAIFDIKDCIKYLNDNKLNDGWTHYNCLGQIWLTSPNFKRTFPVLVYTMMANAHLFKWEETTLGLFMLLQKKLKEVIAKEDAKIQLEVFQPIAMEVFQCEESKAQWIYTTMENSIVGEFTLQTYAEWLVKLQQQIRKTYKTQKTDQKEKEMKEQIDQNQIEMKKHIPHKTFMDDTVWEVTPGNGWGSDLYVFFRNTATEKEDQLAGVDKSGANIDFFTSFNFMLMIIFYLLAWLYLLMLLPYGITHVVPGFICYIWVWLTVGLVEFIIKHGLVFMQNKCCKCCKWVKYLYGEVRTENKIVTDSGKLIHPVKDSPIYFALLFVLFLVEMLCISYWYTSDPYIVAVENVFTERVIMDYIDSLKMSLAEQYKFVVTLF
eukprot:512390_1